MGIPAYFSYIIKENRNLLKSISSTENKIKPTHLFLDSNSIIYDIIRGQTYTPDNAAKFEKECIKEICKQIKYYISLIKPTKLTYVAFDGVAPVAKLKQQQSRRYKNDYLKQKFPKKEPEWNTAAITPGTKFMAMLSLEVTKYFANRDNVIVSTSDEFGEGEHKIFHYIRENETFTSEDTLCVYGLDADLIMLALQHLKYCSNLYLFRETPHFIKSIDKSLNPNELYVVDIPMFNTKIIKELNTVPVKNTISDYVFMSFMLGNDFIPHMPALNIRTNGIDRLFDAYTATVSGTTSLTKDNKIHWPAFKKFIEYLAKNEYHYIKHEYELREKQEKRAMRYYHSKDDEEKLDVKPQIERATERYINPDHDGWQWRYYKLLTDVDIQYFSPRKMCINYLEALEWTLAYYSEGCKNLRWCYHYMYPPLLEHLVDYIPSFDTEFVERNMQKITSDVQLAYVLPKSGAHMLSPNMRSKMQAYYKKAEHMDMEWAFCRYFWEAHLKLPHLDVEELE
jgi:5'-3' exonuclease